MFDLYFFHDSMAPDKLGKKVFSIPFRFRRDIRSQSSRNLTQQCALHVMKKLEVENLKKGSLFNEVGILFFKLHVRYYLCRFPLPTIFHILCHNYLQSINNKTRWDV